MHKISSTVHRSISYIYNLPRRSIDSFSSAAIFQCFIFIANIKWSSFFHAIRLFWASSSTGLLVFVCNSMSLHSFQWIIFVPFEMSVSWSMEHFLFLFLSLSLQFLTLIRVRDITLSYYLLINNSALQLFRGNSATEVSYRTTAVQSTSFPYETKPTETDKLTPHTLSAQCVNSNQTPYPRTIKTKQQQQKDLINSMKKQIIKAIWNDRTRNALRINSNHTFILFG